MQTARSNSFIPQIAEMTMSPNTGSQGGTNCFFKNGWIATVSGQANDPQYLVCISYNGATKQIPDLIQIADRRQGDEKRFLTALELRELFNKMQGLDSTGRI